MKFLGLLFVAVGLFFMMTFIFAWGGIACVAIGGILAIADRSATPGRAAKAAQGVAWGVIACEMVVGVLFWAAVIRSGYQDEAKAHATAQQPLHGQKHAK